MPPCFFLSRMEFCRTKQLVPLTQVILLEFPSHFHQTMFHRCRRVADDALACIDSDAASHASESQHAECEHTHAICRRSHPSTCRQGERHPSDPWVVEGESSILPACCPAHGDEGSPRPTGNTLLVIRCDCARPHSGDAQRRTHPGGMGERIAAAAFLAD